MEKIKVPVYNLPKFESLKRKTRITLYFEQKPQPIDKQLWKEYKQALAHVEAISKEQW